MNFSLIACINYKFALGKNGKLLYHIKSDLMNFKRMTQDNAVIMGRKTFDSLPNGALKNRVNIVITNDRSFKADNVIIVHSVEDAMRICEERYPNLECFVIGGGKIYEEFLIRNVVNTIYLTIVHDDLDGDTHFPIFTQNDSFKEFYENPVIT